MLDGLRSFFVAQSDPNVIRMEYESLNRQRVSKKTLLMLINALIVLLLLGICGAIVQFALQWLIGTNVFTEVLVMRKDDAIAIVLGLGCVWWLLGLRKAIAFDYTRWFLGYSKRNFKKFCFCLGIIVKKFTFFAIVVILVAYCVERYGFLSDKIPALKAISECVLETIELVIRFLVNLI